jgi:hypothetical protein
MILNRCGEMPATLKMKVISTKEGLEKTMALKHSKAISKSLLDVKIKVLLYTLIFLIYVGLMIYAFVYLRLNLSVNSLSRLR